MQFTKRISSAVVIFCLICSSCSTEDPEDFGPSPDLPPLSTLVMDFSNFGGESGGRILASDNWDHAALNVGVWNLIIALELVIPVASFKAAITQNPSFDKNRQLWVWNYDYDFVGKNYTTKLTGQINGYC